MINHDHEYQLPGIVLWLHIRTESDLGVRSEESLLACPLTSKNPKWDFAGMPVVENSPASTGDTGSIPGSGRFHVLRGHRAHVPQLPSPGAPEPVLSHKRSPAPHN